MVDKSNLLNSNGQRLGAGLFVEFSFLNNTVPPTYTLAREDREVDGKVYPSLFRLYMETGDVTEITFVEKYLHDLKQWELICNNKQISEEVAQWRRELKLQKLSEAVRKLEEDALSDSRSSKSSAKFLIERVYQLPSRAGRPSKSKITGDDDRVSPVSVESDFRRLFKDVSGNK